MPVLQLPLRVGGKEGVPEFFAGVHGQPRNWGEVLALKNILRILCLGKVLLWLDDTILMSPLEQPAAK